MDKQQEILIKLCSLMESAFLRISNMSRFINQDKLTARQLAELIDELKAVERDGQWATDLSQQATQLKEQ